jgi:hypothetical protein
MKHIVFRVIAGLILLAAILGIAFFAYNAGVTHAGVANLPASAGQANGQAYPYSGYGAPFWHPYPFFGFVASACCCPCSCSSWRSAPSAGCCGDRAGAGATCIMVTEWGTRPVKECRQCLQSGTSVRMERLNPQRKIRFLDL